MLVLDAMILNTDRHHENWGILMNSPEGDQTHIKLAPSFDHASSLARNESEENCTKWLADRSMNRVAWYANRAKGGIWLSDQAPHGSNPLELVVTLQPRFPSFFTPWLKHVRTIPPGQISALVRQVPDDIITPAIRDFVIALVQYTTKTLAGLP
jgi:hypothetical protein